MRCYQKAQYHYASHLDARHTSVLHISQV